MAHIPKMIPNPAYLESERFAARKELFKDTLAERGECVEDFFPEDYGKQLPETGAWIMLLQSIRVGRSMRNAKTKQIIVPHLSIWYAIHTLAQSHRVIDKIKIHMHQAIIHTPDGDVHVWPHEFTEEDGFYIKFLNPEAGDFDKDKLFYLRSRGLAEAQAKRILLPNLNTPDFCYFVFDPSYSDTFGEGCGMPYLRGKLKT